MNFNDKLQTIRRDSNLSQEELAELIGVSRQAVAKWEAGHTYPDINNLIQLSDLFKVSLDRLIKSDSEGCTTKLTKSNNFDYKMIIDFLCKAKKMTYAGKGNEEEKSTRPKSHDLKYKDGNYLYIDTYLGGEKFSGEEAVWFESTPIWSMNYCGRVLSELFSGDFLKEVLLLVPTATPFRGPLIHNNGDYSYHCTINGSFEWFQGYEEIFYEDTKVYECYFHGGVVK